MDVDTAFPKVQAQSSLRALEDQIKTARTYGALYHPTNPMDSWFCTNCCVFGKGALRCWSCDGSVHAQWVPRLGGGAQSVMAPETEGENGFWSLTDPSSGDSASGSVSLLS